MGLGQRELGQLRAIEKFMGFALTFQEGISDFYIIPIERPSVLYNMRGTETPLGENIFRC